MREAIPPLLTAQLPETPDDPEERLCTCLALSEIANYLRRLCESMIDDIPQTVKEIETHVHRKKSVSASVRRRGSRDQFPVSSATVELAAEAAHCEPARIAKTLSFRTNDGVILIVAAGDTKIDNPKYKARFGCKARMLAFEEVEPEIGHAVGVRPFGVNDGVTVIPMNRSDGSRRYSHVRLVQLSHRGHHPRNWRNSPVSRHGVDVCKGWREA